MLPTPCMSDVDRQLREHVATIPEPLRRAVLAVLEPSDGDERGRAIGDLYATGLMPETAELLIDAEEGPAGGARRDAARGDL